MTINIHNEIALWFDKEDNIAVRCAKCQSRREVANGAQDRDQMTQMLHCPKCASLLEFLPGP